MQEVVFGYAEVCVAGQQPDQATQNEANPRRHWGWERPKAL
jgi:hypothetical protein